MRYALGLLLLMGCSTTQVAKKDSYLDAVKSTYEAAEKAFQNEAYEDAIKGFEEIRSKHPYSKYAVLSDLRLADVLFAQGKWLEAADSYDFYIRFHPRHEQNAYAWFQIAKSYYRAMPRNFFLLPKSYEKDQTATKEALNAVDQYLNLYPEDKSVEEAKKMRAQLREQLAHQDLHVARYYQKHRKKNGAIARYQHLLEYYPDTESGAIAKKQLLLYNQKLNANGGDTVSTEGKNE